MTHPTRTEIALVAAALLGVGCGDDMPVAEPETATEPEAATEPVAEPAAAPEPAAAAEPAARPEPVAAAEPAAAPDPAALEVTDPPGGAPSPLGSGGSVTSGESTHVHGRASCGALPRDRGGD